MAPIPGYGGDALMTGVIWYYTGLSVLNVIVFWLFNRATRENSRAIDRQTETHGMLSDRVTNIYPDLEELNNDLTTTAEAVVVMAKVIDKHRERIVKLEEQVQKFNLTI